MRYVVLLIMLAVVGINVYAATPQEILQHYAAQANEADPSFTEFSAARGEDLYHAKRMHSSGKEVSCAMCHTDNPKNAGQHARTHKAIEPLAPVANPKRLTDPKEVEKWFSRNCKDVLERTCTAQEKGDFITYLLSVN